MVEKGQPGWEGTRSKEQQCALWASCEQEPLSGIHFEILFFFSHSEVAQRSLPIFVSTRNLKMWPYLERHFADIIKEKIKTKLSWIGEGLKSNDSVFTKESEKVSQDWGEEIMWRSRWRLQKCVHSQEMPGTRKGSYLLLEPSVGASPCGCLDFGFLSSRRVRINICYLKPTGL